jgi:hypothetical protein
MKRVFSLFVAIALLAVAAPAPVEAGPLARIAARVRHPFAGNGVPVARRARGGCSGGSCSF